MSTDETGQGGAQAHEGAGEFQEPGSSGEPAQKLVQLITPSGERVSHPEFDLWVQDITDEHLCSLFEDMTVIRRIDVEATALQRQGELALWPPLLAEHRSRRRRRHPRIPERRACLQLPSQSLPGQGVARCPAAARPSAQ